VISILQILNCFMGCAMQVINLARILLSSGIDN